MPNVSQSVVTTSPGVDHDVVTTSGSDIDIVAVYGMAARQYRTLVAFTLLKVDTPEAAGRVVGPTTAGETRTAMITKIWGTGTDSGSKILLIF